MRWTLRVATGLTADTEPSLTVTVEQPPARYIFNVGEGFTRACTQRKAAFSKTKAIFLTRLHPEQIGGFPGVVMSLADMGTREISVCGPQGVLHYVASTRSYSRRTELGVNVIECTEPSTPIFKDENITTYAIPAAPLPASPTPSSSGSSKRKHSASPRSTSPPSKRRGNEGSPRSSTVEGSLNVTPDSRSFVPASLRGVDADAWRRKILGWMFRPQSPPLHPASDSPIDVITVPPPSWKEHFSKRLPPISVPPTAVSYIVVGQAPRGKFDAAKATALGVNGPLRGQLIKGETVVTPQGVTVTPEMCVAPSLPPPAFVFVHCPDTSYIDGIVTSDKFKPSVYGPEVFFHTVIHRVGAGVLEDARYRTWMLEFDSAVHHLVASEAYSPDSIVFSSSALTQLRLSHLDSEVFKLPRYSDRSQKELASFSDLPPNTSTLAQDIEISLQPPKPPQPSSLVPVDELGPTLKAIAEGSYSNPLADIYHEAQEAVELSPRTAVVPGDDVVITPLGTGSAMPSKYRNVSSTLIQIPRWGCMLLDAGEGTWGQIARQFGPGEDGVLGILRDLRCIFISHIHGDHHMGLSKILARRLQLQPQPKEPLYLITDNVVAQYLKDFNELEDLGIWRKECVQMISTRDLHWKTGNGQLHESAIDALRSALGFESVKTVGVAHRTVCHGIVLNHSDGWSLVYSGDTMPCENLVEAGKDSTVLIHEATLSDDQADLALAKAHSTYGQALDIGRRMGAQNILLTHFSQRYPKMPELQQDQPLTEESMGKATALEEQQAPVALAFDLASLRIGSLWKMEKYMPALVKTFEEAEGDESDDVVGEVTEPESASNHERPASPTKSKKKKGQKT